MEMEKNGLKIRVATAEDAAELLDIYRPYVEKTAITFEYEVPSEEEFCRRIQNTLKKYPYLVAEKDGKLLGYAYTGPFVGRAAYQWGVETSIYLREGCTKMGLGKKMYDALEKVSRAQNILNMNACIGYPEVEDEHLTNNSVDFHGHIGFEMVGTFHKCGYKFGTWYHMVWMEKIIAEHPDHPEPIIPFSELEAKTLEKCGVCTVREQEEK